MQRRILILVVIIGAVIIVAIAGVVFFSQRLPAYKLSILPSQLMPFVSREQARATICGKMKGELFGEACQAKFDSVGKNDVKKIGELFLLLKKIENDHGISDYERLLLAQAVFASLPTKDSPLAQRSGFSAWLAGLKNFISGKNIAYAEESNDVLEMGEEEFKKMMMADLKKVVNDLPKGDNAWVINVMVSKYQWINGERQPIYSDQYSEVFDPYPGVSTEPKDESQILYHIQSRVSSRATNQAMYSGTLKEGSGEMIAYSFLIESWNSPPYGSDSVLVLTEVGPSEKYLTSRKDFSEKNYKGENLLSDLLKVVKMPSRQQPAKDLPKENKSAEKIAQTSWGGAEAGETAYENYFWTHLQRPERYPTFQDAYNDTGIVGQFLYSLPIGEPVDLRAYFDTPGVKEYYEDMRKGGIEVPPLDQFLANIDQYQANLGLVKPSEPEAEGTSPVSDSVDPRVEKFEKWLKECYSRPLPKTREELAEQERQDADPSSPCYNPN